MKPITIITGPQGSGKTTKANELAKQFEPDKTVFTCLELQKEEIEIPDNTKLIILDELPIDVDVILNTIAYFYLKGIPFLIFTFSINHNDEDQVIQDIKRFKNVELIECNYHGKG